MTSPKHLISWNVNGLRSILKKGFLDYLKKENPDILCIQETKAHPEQVDLDVNGYQPYWNSAEKKGYSGTLILSKSDPLNVTYNMGISEHDREGRVITLEFKEYFLVNVYTPNSGRDLSRLKYRQKWDKDFLKFAKKIEEKKPVIFCGDLNVAHQEIDLANPASNHENAGFTDEEREGFSAITKSGFIDTFRELNKDPGHYTWWSYMTQARQRNVGWRIDYFCISPSLKRKLKNAFIHQKVMGSDHCPVGLVLS